MKICLFYDRPLAQLLSAHAIRARGLGFKSRVDRIAQCRQRLATAATFLRSCDVHALINSVTRTLLRPLVFYRSSLLDGI